MGQSFAVGPCGPGEHSSKLIRSRRRRRARHSTVLARDIRQLPERFTLEAKVFADGDQPTAWHAAGNGRTTNARPARLRFLSRLVTTNGTASRCGYGRILTEGYTGPNFDRMPRREWRADLRLE